MTNDHLVITGDTTIETILEELLIAHGILPRLGKGWPEGCCAFASFGVYLSEVEDRQYPHP